MRVEQLGTIVSVVRRDYEKKDGTKGVAYTVAFSVGTQVLTDSFYLSQYMTEQEFVAKGIAPGAIGNMVINISNEERTSKDGRPFMSKDWRFVDFKLANAQAAAPAAAAQPQPQQQPASQAVEAPAPDADVF